MRRFCGNDDSDIQLVGRNIPPQRQKKRAAREDKKYLMNSFLV